jgi:putative membrane-bound dehydrogenase-like protein
LTRLLNSALSLLSALCLCQLVATQAIAADIEVPQAIDERLEVTLFASEPDVMTVTALAVDSQSRVLVVESHTHFRPENYAGPETDRIRMLEDTTGDGHADRVTTFFSGTTHTMSIGAHPSGWVYVATRNSVFRIRDTDGDRMADDQQGLIELETECDYPHNGLSGFAFDFDGNVYFGFGENMGDDATLVARDGRRIPVVGGAGGVFRCNDDGSDLRLVATGFWNPFHLCFDTYGRMFTGDNDPGNRPPCRFLSIVEGGNYGYLRRTLEPFIAINGETPGTLPMTSSTGESPTGILAYESDHLPDDYRGDILVASWGEHRIDRYHLQRDGASFRATTQAVIAGGEHFRPAGIAVAPDGSLFVGDWADRSYPLHGKGRVWRISSRQSADRQAAGLQFTGGQSTTSTAEAVASPVAVTRSALRSVDRQQREAAARLLIQQSQWEVLGDALQNDVNPRVRSLALSALLSGHVMTRELAQHALLDNSEPLREQAARTLPAELIDLGQVVRNDESLAVQAAALRRLDDPAAEELVLQRLSDPDPFMQQAARHGLSQVAEPKRWMQLASHQQASVRLAAVLLLRDLYFQEPSNSLSKTDFEAAISGALRDADVRVRLAAAEWIGHAMLQQFHKPLVSGLATQASTPQLFEAYLAALAQLDGVMEKWTASTVGDWWVKRANSQKYVAPLLDNPHASAAALRQSLLFLPRQHPALTIERLSALLHSKDAQVQIAVVGALREHPSEAAHELLFALAIDPARPSDLRAEAIVGLDPAVESVRKTLIDLAMDTDLAVRNEALRSLRGSPLEENQRSKLSELTSRDAEAAELVSRLLAPSLPHDRPDVSDLDAWLDLLDGPADSMAGKRIFFHPHGPGCANCHRIDGRGRAIGPSFVRLDGRLAVKRRQLVEAILQPSKDIDPGYLPLAILTADGTVATGIYYKHGNGIREIIDSQGAILKFKIDEIEQMHPSKSSIMPDGLSQSMTLQELKDVLAYLLEPVK